VSRRIEFFPSLKDFKPGKRRAQIFLFFSAILFLFFLTGKYLPKWILPLSFVMIYIFIFFDVVFSVLRRIYGIRLLYLFVSISIIIFSFALVYQDMGGIVDSSGTVITDFSTCLYFSVVTFTTLGYGDFHPTDAARGIAAFEAFLGYFCMGILVGVVIFLLTRQQQYALAAKPPPPLS